MSKTAARNTVGVEDVMGSVIGVSVVVLFVIELITHITLGWFPLFFNIGIIGYPLLDMIVGSVLAFIGVFVYNFSIVGFGYIDDGEH